MIGEFMSTRRLTFFALPNEILPLLSDAFVAGSLAACVDQGDDIVTDKMMKSYELSGMPPRLNVFQSKDATLGVSYIRNNRRPLGVVNVELGGISENVLLLSEMSCSDEYRSRDTGVMVRSDHKFVTFNICIKLLRDLWLPFDVFAESLRTGNAKGPYAQIRVSRGAADFFEAGGILKQPGVANVKFGLTRRQL
jgi:hypothetical protein